MNSEANEWLKNKNKKEVLHLPFLVSFPILDSLHLTVGDYISVLLSSLLPVVNMNEDVDLGFNPEWWNSVMFKFHAQSRKGNKIVKAWWWAFQ